MTQSNQDSPKVARVSFTDQHDHPFYYDKDGNRIVDLSEPEPYRPMYDIECANKTPNYPGRTDNEFHVYFDVHTQIAHFRSKTYFFDYLKALRKIILHKYLWRHFS